MMQKGFIFLLIILISTPFASGNPASLQFSLGCEAVIPCQHCRRDSSSLTWFYQKDEHSDKIRLFHQRDGLPFQHQSLRPRISVLQNCSLVISDLTDDDQGVYSCQQCFQGNWWKEESTFVSVKKEILKENHKTFYITAGSSFTHACPGELTSSTWTFEASNMTTRRNSVQETRSLFETSNKLMHIENVKRADGGKYTCWTSGCDGHRRKLLSINLCVITVHHHEDSLVSCAVTCHTDASNVKPNGTLQVQTATRNISVLVDAYGSCTAKLFDGYSAVNSTHRPSDPLNKTTGAPTEPGYLILVAYGTLAALACLILMALLIYSLRSRLRAAFPVYLCCCGLNCRAEEDTSVVYASVVIRRPERTTNTVTVTDPECIYSKIKV